MLQELPMGRAQGIVVIGRVTAARAWALELSVGRHLAAGRTEVCIDVTDAQPSEELAATLVRCHRRLLAGGGWLTVICPHGAAREPLEGASYPVLSGRDTAVTALG